MADEFYSFDEALKELRLKEEELKRLVSEGEIRAFRQGDTMRLRKADVHNLRNELSGGEVVDLGGVSEELVFEDDADLETGMATEEISEADTILEDDVEDVGEVELEEDELAPERAAPVRRATAVTASAAAREEETEPVWVLGLAILTTAVLVFLAVPVCWSIATGNTSSVARGIAGLFAG